MWLSGKYTRKNVIKIIVTKVKISQKLNHSQESRFKAATHLEDLHHIQEIMNTNVGGTNSPKLTEILYKSVTRPVQVNELLSQHITKKRMKTT